ncbi:Choline-sulfatase [Pirellula sp. SH-Sr6A]|uniref:sulfatase family protein n=1 Tax=Pirellula sp. SH-Sr6A TaxID=1632865 RepID=UPI00078E7609|nr:sulfatase [Pirellula sp. SH-Sr6A]AMV31452.1 Choline-sulfatase [Pirellula sp. SH-Sr6A]
MNDLLWRYAASFVFTLFVVGTGTTEVQASDRWNLLLVTADDLNGDAAQWSGSKLPVTPNLDAFAKTSHRFINHHVTISICQPGRAVLMTGRLPHRNGALGFQPTRQDIPTLVEILQKEGYFAGVIAKAAHMMPSSKFPWDSIGEQALGKQPVGFSQSFRSMVAEAKKRNQPFFINANICDPHRPFISGSGKRKQDGNESLDGVRTFKSEDVTVPDFLEDLPRVREEVAQYTTSVSRFDLSFGLLLEELKRSGNDEDTVVVFLSDHGMSFPFSKATVYYNGTWSPLLIRVPGQLPAKEHREFVSSVDAMPSLLQILNVAPPNGMDGRSWAPLLTGEEQSDRDYVITHVNTVSSGKSFAQRCIRTKNRALLFHAWPGGPNPFRVEAMSGLSFAAMNESTDPNIRARVEQLVRGEPLMFFDTNKDPSERVNLLGDRAYAAEVKETSQKLLEQMRRSEDPLTDAFAKAAGL